MTSAKAGWYPDVKVTGGERYWDGQQWTDQRRDGQGRVPVAPTNDGRAKLPKRSRGAGSSTYALAGFVGYVVAGGFYANDEPQVAGIVFAFALGFSLIAIIAIGVQLGLREHAEDLENRS